MLPWFTVPAGAVSAAIADRDVVWLFLIGDPDRNCGNQIAFHRSTLFTRNLMKVDEACSLASGANHVAPS
jgi:hypothetical protein